jgi:NADH-quinone oxidoreductase subunit C
LVPAREGIIDQVKAAIGDAFLSAKDEVDEVSIDVASRKRRRRAAHAARQLDYQQLMEIAGVDYPERRRAVRGGLSPAAR